MSKDAKPDTWMPLVIGDYKKDTGRLTRDLHGGYLLLIMEYWTTGPLADDDDELAAIVLASPREWKARIRPKLERFFRIKDGRWHHKRIDYELAEATERKARNAARAKAAAEARWNDGNGDKPRPSRARSNATSTPKGKLEQCPISPTTEVDGPTGHSTLCGQEHFFNGPKEVRDAFCARFGDTWCRAWLDPCTWQDVPERALIPLTRTAGVQIIRDARDLLAKFGLSVLEKAA